MKKERKNRSSSRRPMGITSLVPCLQIVCLLSQDAPPHSLHDLSEIVVLDPEDRASDCAPDEIRLVLVRVLAASDQIDFLVVHHDRSDVVVPVALELCTDSFPGLKVLIIEASV